MVCAKIVGFLTEQWRRKYEMTLDLTVIVCAYNAERTIKDCLESVKANHPKEIILVDGGSSDSTRSIAESYVGDIIDDKARGLANARNMGMDRAKTKYLSFVGPDNVMPEGSFANMINYMEHHRCAIVSAITVLRDRSNYWGWAQNIFRIRKYRPGYKDAVGTPTLFRTSTAKKYRYNEFMKNSDDTEICSRMAKDGLRFAISDTLCYEIGFDNFSSVVERWTRYGRGDYLFYLIMKKNWSLSRRVKSLLHPFVDDCFTPLRGLKFRESAILPFLCLIVFLRYWGWLKAGITHVERKASAYNRAYG